jgi:hypothetical protein
MDPWFRSLGCFDASICDPPFKVEDEDDDEDEYD